MEWAGWLWSVVFGYGVGCLVKAPTMLSVRHGIESLSGVVALCYLELAVVSPWATSCLKCRVCTGDLGLCLGDGALLGDLELTKTLLHRKFWSFSKA